MMHKRKQTEALVAQSAARFCGARVVAHRTVVQCVKNLASKPAVVALERRLSDLVRLQPIPLINQFLTAWLQRIANHSRVPAAINHGLTVMICSGSEQMSPAELVAMIFQMTVSRIAIADDDAVEPFTQQFGDHRARPGCAHSEQRAEVTHNRPQPGFTAVLSAAGFVDVDRGRNSDIRRNFIIPRLHRPASDALQTADLAVGDLKIKQIPQQRADDPLTESSKAAGNSLVPWP